MLRTQSCYILTLYSLINSCHCDVQLSFHRSGEQGETGICLQKTTFEYTNLLQDLFKGTLRTLCLRNLKQKKRTGYYVGDHVDRMGEDRLVKWAKYKETTSTRLPGRPPKMCYGTGPSQLNRHIMKKKQVS